jgi:hypothetical protein
MYLRYWVACTNTQVVIYRAFFYFFPCNHIINIKKKSFPGEVKDSVIFPLFFYFMSFINLYSH